MHYAFAKLSHASRCPFLKPRTVAKPVGEVLKAIREASGRPRSEIARAAQLDPSVLWRLENPREGAQPSFELVHKVAIALGVTLDEVASSIDRRQKVVEPSDYDLLDRIRLNVDTLERSLTTSSRKVKKVRIT